MPSITAIPLSSLTAFDWFLIAVLVVSSLRAWSRGIIRILLSLGGLIVGIIVASWNYVSLAATLHKFIESLATAQVIAFILLLALVMTIFALIARALRRAAKAVGLGFFDRLLGGAFGFLRGVLIGVVIMMVIAAFVPDSSLVGRSRLAPYLLAGAHAVSFVLPDHFRDQIAQGGGYLLQQTPELLRPHTLEQHR